jgi:hypothetical protein
MAQVYVIIVLKTLGCILTYQVIEIPCRRGWILQFQSCNTPSTMTNHTPHPSFSCSVGMLIVFPIHLLEDIAFGIPNSLEVVGGFLSGPVGC